MSRIFLVVLMFLALDPRSGSAQAGGALPDTISSGDVLRMVVFREPELSGLLQVPANGMVTFGMIGPLKVTGMTADELRKQVNEMYAKYLANYTIQLDVLRKVTIAGAVFKPGVYPLDDTNTVRDAIAIAGGIAENGRADRIELRRRGEIVDVLLADRMIADSPIRSGDQIYVPEKSYVSRNGSTMVAALTGVLGIIVTLLVK
jgi:protein involved in polysaccharide export with SLBB domain